LTGLTGTAFGKGEKRPRPIEPELNGVQWIRSPETIETTHMLTLGLRLLKKERTQERELLRHRSWGSHCGERLGKRYEEPVEVKPRTIRGEKGGAGGREKLWNYVTGLALYERGGKRKKRTDEASRPGLEFFLGNGGEHKGHFPYSCKSCTGLYARNTEKGQGHNSSR